MVHYNKVLIYDILHEEWIRCFQFRHKITTLFRLHDYSNNTQIVAILFDNNTFNIIENEDIFYQNIDDWKVSEIPNGQLDGVPVQISYNQQH